MLHSCVHSAYLPDDRRALYVALQQRKRPAPSQGRAGNRRQTMTTLKNITGDTALTIATTKAHTDFAALLSAV